MMNSELGFLAFEQSFLTGLCACCFMQYFITKQITPDVEIARPKLTRTGLEDTSLACPCSFRVHRAPSMKAKV